MIALNNFERYELDHCFLLKRPLEPKRGFLKYEYLFTIGILIVTSVQEKNQLDTILTKQELDYKRILRRKLGYQC